VNLRTCEAMKTAVELPQEIMALAQGEGCTLESSIQTAVVLDAYAQGRISAGKAARLLDLDRLGFEDLRIAGRQPASKCG
jgi:predicted HTH domain antitoxin